MRYHTQSQAPLRVWGIERKPGSWRRILDFLKHIFILAIILIIWSAAQTAVASEPDYAATRQGTLFYRAANDGQYHAAPLLHTDVDMQVSGFINRARLVQTFTNGSDQWVEGIYVFPLPENSAVDHMRIRVGDRLIEGQIREKAEARRTYEQARQAGKHASLLEQERPNMFTTSVANIGPHESIRVEIEYQQTLHYEQGGFSLRLPLAITPRYIPGVDHTRETSAYRHTDDGNTVSNPAVSDAQRITPPVALDQKINPVSLHIELDAGFPVSDIKSPYFPIQLNSHGEGRFSINLAEQHVYSDHDFELRWKPLSGAEPRAALFREHVGNAYFYLGMLLPPTNYESNSHSLPKEVIYVIDTSGSMGGVSIRQASQALLMAIKHLRGRDSFNVIEFNSDTHQLFPQAVPATFENKTRALDYVAGLEAGGGTEMMGAMQAALAKHSETPRLRQVIFLTDGAVGNEDALFAYIRHHLGDSRLFTIGIGSAPNSHFMSKAAQFGRGTYTYISRTTEVADKMRALFAKLDSPVMRDLKLRHEFGSFDISRRHLPDLYAGEPLIFTAHSASVNGELILSGQRSNQLWQASLFLQQAHQGDGIGKLWARERISSLIDSLKDGAHAEAVRRQVIELALAHHLVSKYTSLVAVDVTPVRPMNTALSQLAMPVNLPQGQEAGKIFGVHAQTGTAQNLYWLLGIVFLCLAITLLIITRRERAIWPA